MTIFLRMILAALIFLAVHRASAAGGDSLERICYARFECEGHVNLVSDPLAYIPVNQNLGIRFHFPITSGAPYPSIQEIYARDKVRIEAFEKRCNVARYRRLPLDPNISVAWNQDSRHLNAALSFACRQGQASVGGPCEANSHCAGSPSAVKCDSVARTCVLDSHIQTQD